MSEESCQSSLFSLATIVDENEEIIQRAHSRASMLVGLPTGFMRLNALTLGYRKGDLIIVAGLPSMGKTAFALNTISHLAIDNPYRVAFFSLEAARSQVGFRLQCSNARVNLFRLQEGRLSKEERQALILSSQRMREAKLFVDDTPAITLEQIGNRARELKESRGLDFLCVDHIGLMGPRGKSGSAQSGHQIGILTKGLKRLAGELEIPVMVLSQLSSAGKRKSRGRYYQLPTLSDLPGLGDMEQDADVVIFLSRPDYFNRYTDKKNVCDLFLAKQRNGPTDTMMLGWSSDYTRFCDLSSFPE